MRNEEELKTFILGVGFQKCGTTWLHRYLQQFECFHGGFKKEYHIWDAVDIPLLRRKRLPKPSSLDEALKPHKALRYRMQNQTEFYFEYFNSLYNSNVRLSADITPSYCGLKRNRLEFIRSGFEQIGINCKVLVLIRNPISRIKSAVRSNLDKNNYNEGIKRGETNFFNAVRQYYNSEHCQIRTNYQTTIKNIFESFGSKEIYVGIYENMFEEDEIEKLSNFLGVVPKFDFASVQVNKTKNKTEYDEALDNELRNYYKDVYEFCYQKFPLTRSLWS